MPYQVLLIDDDRYFRSELKEFLDEFKIIEASNGQQAISILKKPHQIDLIILDEMLPTQRGTELLPEIRKVSPETKIVMLTGHGSKEVVIDALKGQALDFIEKPLSAKKLEQIKSRILAVPCGQNDNRISGVKGKIERAKYFAERNFDKRLTLEDVANEVCLSPKYLSRIFKENMGISFTDYKLQIRIEKAKELLSTTGDNIEEISYKLGYQNPESFCKVFREFTQLTPREFREKERLKKLSRAPDGKLKGDSSFEGRRSEVIKRILSYSQDAIIEFNMRGRITFWSDSAEKLYGWSSKKMIPRSILDLHADKSGDDFKSFISQSEFMEQEKMFKIQRLKKNGETIDVYSRVIPQINSKGRCRGFLCFDRVLNDLEDSKEISSLEAYPEEGASGLNSSPAISPVNAIEEIDDDRSRDIVGRFASIIAHEMRRPFGSIQMAVWNIRKKINSEIVEDNIKTIEKMVEDGERIIKHLLSYSVIQPPQYQFFDIAVLVNESIEEVQRSSDNLFMDLDLNINDILGKDIETDEDHFKQVLGNVLKNAFEAVLEESAGKVKVVAGIDDNQLIIEVADNGKGIAAADLTNIYEPFFSRKHKGIGLGLTICNQILNLHQGKLRIDSRPGKGVTASIALPLTQ